MPSPRATRWSCGDSAASASGTGTRARAVIRRPAAPWTFLRSAFPSSRSASACESSSTREGPPGALKRLWAPWRMAWIGGSRPAAGCVFCIARDGVDDRAALGRRSQLPDGRGRHPRASRRAHDDVGPLAQARGVSGAPSGAGADTPMMQQYRELKRRFPDHLLLFRLGDFYELFLEDAELGARLLSLTLPPGQGAPMAGIPHPSADGYIARLVQAGQKIAICEQMEAPGKGKKLLKRDVVRVITPGTLTDTAYLSGAANNYLLAVATQGGALTDSIGVALLDVSTGEFLAGEDTDAEGSVLAAALLRRPSEILMPEALRGGGALLTRLQATGAALTFGDPAVFAGRRAAAELGAHFGVASLDAFGVGDLTLGLSAAVAALAYVRATQGERLGHLARLGRLTAADCLTPDGTAGETLELLRAAHGTRRNSLVGPLDQTG